MLFLKSSFVLALLTVCAMSMAPVAKAQVSFDIHLGRPSPSHVWVDGYYMEGPRREYVRPHWENPPDRQARWHSGKWYKNEETWPGRRGNGRGWHEGRTDQGRGRGPGNGRNKH